MKINTLLLTLLCLSTFNSTIAQTNKQINGDKKNPSEQTKYGIIGGYSFNKFISSSKSFEYMDFKRKPAPVGGIFVEYPFPESILSLHCELLYMKSAYSYNETFQMQKYLLIDLKTINLPVILRISDYSRKTALFVDMGINFTFNVENQWHIYNISEEGEAIYLNEQFFDNLIDDALIGYQFGLGIQRNFGKVRAYLETRIGKSTPLINGDFQWSQNQIVAGVGL